MMAKPLKYLEFVIKESYTPSTLPMARLAEYLADLAALLGETKSVHFVELRESSSSVIHAIEHEAIPKVEARIHAARNGGGDSEIEAVSDRIDRRLRADNAHGVLREMGDKTGRLLFFPGIGRDVDETYGPFSEQGQLYGIPIAIGGKTKVVNVNLEDGERTYYCEATRDVALQIAPLLFNHHLRVHGVGRYLRDEDGQWQMKSFRISHFDKLDARPLAETVERLRGITRKVGLDGHIIAKLADLREG